MSEQISLRYFRFGRIWPLVIYPKLGLLVAAFAYAVLWIFVAHQPSAAPAAYLIAGVITVLILMVSRLRLDRMLMGLAIHNNSFSGIYLNVSPSILSFRDVLTVIAWPVIPLRYLLAFRKDKPHDEKLNLGREEPYGIARSIYTDESKTARRGLFRSDAPITFVLLSLGKRLLYGDTFYAFVLGTLMGLAGFAK